jgi:hypothetical protein
VAEAHWRAGSARRPVGSADWMARDPFHLTVVALLSDSGFKWSQFYAPTYTGAIFGFFGKTYTF